MFLPGTAIGLGCRVSMEATALFVILATALSAALSAQIPERVQWEITFAQVEAAAGLSDMRTSPQTFEARLMQRPSLCLSTKPDQAQSS